MVSWGTSFKIAVKAAIFGILWLIVGGLIAIIGGGAALIAALQGGGTIELAGLLGGGIIAIIGAIIAVFGYSASLIKFTIEGAEEEVLGKR